MMTHKVMRENAPLILTMPHSGTWVSRAVHEKLNDRGHLLQDTDWHIPRLYEGLFHEATIIEAHFHRYMIDPNRPTDQSKHLYATHHTTALCPTTDFDGAPIYHLGQAPNDTEIQHRLETYHRPYHQAIQNEINRLKKRFTHVMVFDCHSIRSKIPHLFKGTLPDLNIGTADTTSAAKLLEDSVVHHCKAQTYALNGRFKGGWTTRFYGDPSRGVHAIQMEIAQHLYLLEERAPFTYSVEKAKKLRSLLKKILLDLNHLLTTLPPSSSISEHVLSS